MFASLRREVRTCTSHCVVPCIFITLHLLVRHLHSHTLSQNNKNSVDRAATGKTFCFVTLTYGSRTANRMDSLHQIVNGLVGNVDWGESFTVVVCEFPGPNTSSSSLESSGESFLLLVLRLGQLLQ